jgi:hypothetical protein
MSRSSGPAPPGSAPAEEPLSDGVEEDWEAMDEADLMRQIAPPDAT